VGRGINTQHEELHSNIRKTLIAIVVLLSAVVFIGMAFESQLAALTIWLEARLGFAGLALLMFVNDTFVSPLPPDLVLFIFSKSAKAEYAPLVISVFGVCSALAGVVGWRIGKVLQNTRIPKMIFGDRLQKSEALAKRYGSWAVLIGALTPIPYSLTTWTAGMMGLEFKKIFWPCLARIPRFWIYYYLILNANKFTDFMKLIFLS